MKKAGIILLIIGLAITLFTGLSFVTREKVVDIGELEISAKKNHSLTWSPIFGIVIIAIGAGFFLLSKKGSMSAQ
jgi:hypothetical protein